MTHWTGNLCAVNTTQEGGGWLGFNICNNIVIICTGWAKEWCLGCVNSRPAARGSQEAGFTQPRDHSFAQPCRISHPFILNSNRRCFNDYNFISRTACVRREGLTSVHCNSSANANAYLLILQARRYCNSSSG